MKAQHTRGPWWVSKIHRKGQECSIAIHPCHFYFTGKIENINRVDAQLIASAPDLLEALELIMDNLGWVVPDNGLCIMPTDVFVKIKQAIAKAKSEG